MALRVGRGGRRRRRPLPLRPRGRRAGVPGRRRLRLPDEGHHGREGRQLDQVSEEKILFFYSEVSIFGTPYYYAYIPSKCYRFNNIAIYPDSTVVLHILDCKQTYFLIPFLPQGGPPGELPVRLHDVRLLHRRPHLPHDGRARQHRHQLLPGGKHFEFLSYVEQLNNIINTMCVLSGRVGP